MKNIGNHKGLTGVRMDRGLRPKDHRWPCLNFNKKARGLMAQLKECYYTTIL